MAAKERKLFGNLVTKVMEVPSKSLYYRRLSWLLFGAETPMLTSGCFLNDGRLLLSDHNNKKLILFDENYNHVKHIGLSVDGWPYDIARGTMDGEVYIVLSDGVLLKCRLYDDDITILGRIQVPVDVRCVSVLPEVIYTGSSSAVSELKPDGDILNSIPKSGKNTYITLSSQQRTLYHNDGDSILCRTLDGQKVYRFDDKRLVDPRGMCLDHDDNLYVCGYKSQNLFQISKDGKKGRVVMKRLHKILKPVAILYHPKRQQFIVTSYGEDIAFEVYQVSC